MNAGDDLLDPARLELLARQRVAAYDYEAAAALLEKIAHRAPGLDALYACCLRHQVKFHDARRVLEPHLSALRPHPDVLTERAMLDMIDRPDDAMAGLERALAIVPNHVHALHGLAWILERRHRTGPERDRMHALLERALAIAPGDPQVLQTSGIAILHEGRIEEGLPILQRVVHLRSEPPSAGTPYQFEAHGNLACAYARLGRLEDALEQIEAAIACSPSWRKSIARQHLRNDADLQILAHDPRFVAHTHFDDAIPFAERLAQAEQVLAKRSQPSPEKVAPAALLADLRSDDELRQIRALEAIAELSWVREGECDHLSTAEHATLWRLDDAVGAVREAPDLLRALLASDSDRVLEVLASVLACWLGSVHNDDVAALGASMVCPALDAWLPHQVRPAAELLRALANNPRSVPQAAPRLAALLAQTDLASELRAHAVAALGAQGSAEHLDLVRSLLTHHDADTRAAAISALGALGSEVEAPERWLDDPSEHVRQQTLLTFGATLAPRALSAVRACWQARDACEQPAWEVLRDHLDGTFVPEAIALLDRDRYALWAWDWLRKHELGLEHLEQVLALDPVVHRQAAVPKLAALLRSQGPRALGSNLPERLGPAGLAALGTFGAWDPIEGAVECVGYLGWRRARPWLLELLPEADARLTASIAGALATVGEARDAALLRQLGSHRSPYVRSRATLSLAVLAGEAVDLTQLRVELHTVWALTSLTHRLPAAQVDAFLARADTAAEAWDAVDRTELRRHGERAHHARATSQ